MILKVGLLPFLKIIKLENMYSKLSPLRLIISITIVVAMIMVLTRILSATNEFDAPRFLGLGMTMLGLGAALVILSSKDIFFADGRKATLKDLKSGMLAIGSNTIYISNNAETLSPAEEMKNQLKYLSKLETIKPFLYGGVGLMMIGGIISLFSFLNIIHIF